MLQYHQNKQNQQPSLYETYEWLLLWKIMGKTADAQRHETGRRSDLQVLCIL